MNLAEYGASLDQGCYNIDAQLIQTRTPQVGTLSTPETKSAETDAQGLLPIRSVAQVTGVNPITLRAWERRYDLIRPTRTPAGHRLYSQQDIRTIQRIQELAEGGMGFAQIAALLEQESQAGTSAVQPTSAPVTPPRSLLDRVMQATMNIDPSELRMAEASALLWLSPEDYLREVLIESLAYLEARPAWPDRDVGLVWLSEYIKGRADWIADAPGRPFGPLVVIDQAAPGQPLSAGGLRLFTTLHDDQLRARLLPSGLSEFQRAQLTRRWDAQVWVRLGRPEQIPEADTARIGAKVFWCDLPALSPTNDEQSVDFMQGWRQTVEQDIQRCRQQIRTTLDDRTGHRGDATRH